MKNLRSRLPVLIAERQIQTGTKITQKELAQATGLTEATLSRLMNATDTKRIEASTVWPICEYFGCDLGDLFTFFSEDDFRALK